MCPVCKALLYELYCDHFNFTSPTCHEREVRAVMMKSCDLHENVIVRYDEDRLFCCPLCRVENENKQLNEVLIQRENELKQSRSEVECLSTKLSQLIALQNLHASSSAGK